MHAYTHARTHAFARALSLSQSVGMNSQVINVTFRELRRRAVNSETEASALRRLGSHNNTKKNLLESITMTDTTRGLRPTALEKFCMNRLMKACRHKAAAKLTNEDERWTTCRTETSAGKPEPFPQLLTPTQ